MSTANINGITIGYDDEGTGDDVLVLVHGHPFDRSMWRPQVEHFSAAGWRVIAADLRGYGETTVVPGVTPLSAFAGDVAALLDHAEQARIWGRRARLARGGVWVMLGVHVAVAAGRIYERAAWWKTGLSLFNVAALSACLYAIYWAQRRSEKP